MATSLTSEYHTMGVLQLAFGVVAQAVEDYKKLEACGIIKDGELTGNWPSKKTAKGAVRARRVVGISSSAEVSQLIYFLKSDMCTKAMSHISGGLSASRIREQLGLSKEAK